MHEILFRGRRKYDKQWLQGNLVIDKHGNPHVISPDFFYEDGHHLGYYDDTDLPVFLDDETVGQFTGLTDKNGKRIFEGDIISCFHENLLVEWDAGAFQSSNYDKLYPLDHFVARNCEVAGNIHDNPNLIAGGGEDGN